MVETTADVFFNGLSMIPRPCGRMANVPGMELRIGACGTPVREDAVVVHGIVMGLMSPERAAHYTEPGVAAYAPGPIAATGEDGVAIGAFWYNLPDGASGARNAGGVVESGLAGQLCSRSAPAGVALTG